MVSFSGATAIRRLHQQGEHVPRLHWASFAVVFAAIGSVFLFAVHADSGGTAVVLNSQSGVLAGGASLVSDGSAIGGKAVTFGGGTTGTGGGGTSGGGGTKSGGGTGGGGSTGSTGSGCSVGGAIAPCMNGTGSGTGTSGYGTPAFDDEFNGTALNTSNWVAGRREGGTSVCTSDCGGYNPSYESELFEPSAVTEANGAMTITATKQSPDGGKHSWTSGAVEMRPGKNFIYGYFEARVKVPAPTQAWTAYWLNGADTWPPELDIFEFHFYKGQPTFNNDGPPGTQGANLSGWPNAEAYGGTSTDFTQWHTYGLLWTSSSLKVYFDGVLQNIDTSDTGIPTTSMYPLFDYAIDSSSTNPPSGTKMSVDYLRIWCPGGGTSCTTSK